MENKINEMKAKIEMLIKIANGEFKRCGWDTSHELRLARIDGCLDMLAILTGKNYWYDENGLYEEKN